MNNRTVSQVEIRNLEIHVGNLNEPTLLARKAWIAYKKANNMQRPIDAIELGLIEDQLFFFKSMRGAK